MPENVMPGPVCDLGNVREAVCIHTRKIFDSCRDKDCVEDLRFYPTASAMELLSGCQMVRGGTAELLYVYTDVEPVTFNRGFYCWDSHEERLRPVLAQLAQLRHTCEAFRTGQLRVLRAEDGILHYQRVGKVETAEIIVNRTEHIIVEPLASGKHTEVNPMGFTIVVEEVGHNPNHSYYDYQ